jgi:hypothetical protein
LSTALTETTQLAECELVLRDRNRGMPVSAVCEKWGFSPATMHRRIEVALAANRVDDVVEYRERELAALDDLLDRWQGQFVIAEQLAAEALRQDPISIDTLTQASRIRADALNSVLRVQERKAKLAGLDAPVRADIRVTEVTQADLELEELAREARARVRS